MKISKVYTLATNPGTIFMLVCAILSLTFTTPSFAVTGNSGSNNSIDLRGHSGEDLFKAIFMLQGDLVNEIPSLRGLKEQMSGYDLSRAEGMYTSMRRNHSSYFSELEESVNSDNHYQIEKTLQKGSELIILSQYTQMLLSDATQVYENMPDLTQYDLNNDAERSNALKAVSRFMADEFDVPIDSLVGFFVGPLAVAIAVAFVILIASVAVVIDEHSVAPDRSEMVDILQSTTITKDKIIGDLVNL